MKGCTSMSNFLTSATYFLTAAGGGDFWQKFQVGVEGFFKNGLGGPGAKGFGIAILVIGFITACISFAVHKFNQSSRMPGWITCLAIAVVGSILMGGVEAPMQLFEQARNTLYGWFGISTGT